MLLIERKVEGEDMGEVIFDYERDRQIVPGCTCPDHVDLEIRKVKCSPSWEKNEPKIHSYEGADRYL